MDKQKELDAETLAAAFVKESKKPVAKQDINIAKTVEPENEPHEVAANQKTEDGSQSSKKPAGKNKIVAGIAILVVGIATCIAGLVFMLINLMAKPVVRDAEYLVQVGKWAREDALGVIWNFTEIGKGTLTTNNHINDYDFIWALDGDTLKIETDWLYDLNNEFIYTLNKDTGKLTLNEDMTFVPLITDEN